jgi:hypothetical protein
MENKTREHLVDGSIWLRGLHMLVLAVAYNVVEAMLAFTAIFQFFSALLTGKVNEPLLQFAKNGSIYIQEALEFLTFNSEIRPFPFNSWPNEAHTGEAWLNENELHDDEQNEGMNHFDQVDEAAQDIEKDAAKDVHPNNDDKPQ